MQALSNNQTLERSIFLRVYFPIAILLAGVILTFPGLLNAQPAGALSSVEYGDDGIPVLIKNLPDWEQVAAKAEWVDSKEKLVSLLGEREILAELEFSSAIESVVAYYPAGKLFLIEYATPQLASQADKNFKEKMSETASTGGFLYRRTGNYIGFFFDVSDEKSANALLEKLYYGKVVQWLDQDPNLYERLDRYTATTTAQLILSTMFAISVGLGSTLTVGIIIGLIFFRYRQKQRKKWKAFSDAGGMTRINLDGFSDQPSREE